MQGNIFINNSNKWISPPRPISLHDWQILNNSVKIIRQNDLLLVSYDDFTAISPAHVSETSLTLE